MYIYMCVYIYIYIYIYIYVYIHTYGVKKDTVGSVALVSCT